jgi:hypothetical protein
MTTGPAQVKPNPATGHRAMAGAPHGGNHRRHRARQPVIRPWRGATRRQPPARTPRGFVRSCLLEGGSRLMGLRGWVGSQAPLTRPRARVGSVGRLRSSRRAASLPAAHDALHRRPRGCSGQRLRGERERPILGRRREAADRRRAAARWSSTNRCHRRCRAARDRGSARRLRGRAPPRRPSPATGYTRVVRSRRSPCPGTRSRRNSGTSGSAPRFTGLSLQ